MTVTPAALILDFGGVLTSDLWDSVRGCARREGLPDNALVDLLHDDGEIRQLFAGLERGDVSQTEFEERLAAAAGIRPDRLLARMCADLQPNQPMLAAVTHLRSVGVQIGVLSNSWGSGYFSPYEGYDLDLLADAVVVSDQVRLRKPEPAIFHLSLDRLGADADRSVFIDDVAANLPPAAAMGITVIHHVDTQRTLTELEQTFAEDLTPAAAAPVTGQHPDQPN